MEDKAKELKAEIFDIIRQQEQLQNAFSRLQTVKDNKLKELKELENKKEK